MAMSPRLLRPRNALHPEAAAWAARVVANGGTVGTSLPAVDRFCRAIDAAGIRDRFYRLSLMCGGTSGTAVGLNSALVPLYRGQSLGGTQYGDPTDTNSGGLFVGGDYNETGASGGLKGSGSRGLLTGIAQSALTADSRHISAYECAQSTGTFDCLLGADNGVSVNPWSLSNLNTLGTISYLAQANASGGQVITSASYTGGGGLWVGTGSSTAPVLYRNGSVAASTTGATAATPGSETLAVFAQNRSGALADNTTARIAAYSIGLGMTAAQAAAYYTAMQAFQTAMTRSV